MAGERGQKGRCYRMDKVQMGWKGFGFYADRQSFEEF